MDIDQGQSPLDSERLPTPEEYPSIELVDEIIGNFMRNSEAQRHFLLVNSIGSYDGELYKLLTYEAVQVPDEKEFLKWPLMYYDLHKRVAKDSLTKLTASKLEQINQTDPEVLDKAFEDERTRDAGMVRFFKAYDGYISLLEMLPGGGLIAGKIEDLMKKLAVLFNSPE